MATRDDPCCQAIEQPMEKYDYPFEYPIRFNAKTGDMKADKLCIGVGKLTPSGNLSTRGRGWIIVNFCPFCGEELTSPDEDLG